MFQSLGATGFQEDFFGVFRHVQNPAFGTLAAFNLPHGCEGAWGKGVNEPASPGLQTALETKKVRLKGTRPYVECLELA